MLARAAMVGVLIRRRKATSSGPGGGPNRPPRPNRPTRPREPLRAEAEAEACSNGPDRRPQEARRAARLGGPDRRAIRRREGEADLNGIRTGSDAGVGGSRTAGSRERYSPSYGALREHDIVRLVDLLFIAGDENGEIQAIEHSDLAEDESETFRVLAGNALLGMGAVGEEGAKPGRRCGCRGRKGLVIDPDDVWYVADAYPPGPQQALPCSSIAGRSLLRNSIERAAASPWSTAGSTRRISSRRAPRPPDRAEAFGGGAVVRGLDLLPPSVVARSSCTSGAEAPISSQS